MIKNFLKFLLVGVLIGISTYCLFVRINSNNDLTFYLPFIRKVSYDRDNWDYNSYAARKRLECSKTEHVDHIVALKEAFDSGGFSWSLTKKKQFANDPLNQWCLDGSINMSKSDKDLGEWNGGSCDIRKHIGEVSIEVKRKYGLKMDNDEEEATRMALNNDC